MATRELDELRKQLETLQRSHDTLLKSLTASNGSFGPSDVPRLRRNATQRGDAVFADTSTLSDDSSDDEDDFFVQSQLPSQSFDHEHLREHLRTHNWDEHGRDILASLVSDPAKLSKQPHLFHLGPGPADDRSHYSHFQYVIRHGPMRVLTFSQSVRCRFRWRSPARRSQLGRQHNVQSYRDMAFPQSKSGIATKSCSS